MYAELTYDEWAKNLREEGQREGIREGRREGWLEGVLEGKLENARDTIFRLYRNRLGAVPASIEAQVKEIRQLERLDALVELLISAPASAELEAQVLNALQEPTSIR
ncbi:MAG: hypothetical protein ACKO6N_20260 [Myxococcota bacterium]